MPLRRVIRCLLCRGNDPGSPVDQSLVIRVSPDAEAVPLVGLQQNLAATQLMDSSRSTPLPPSLKGEHLEAPIEHHQDHAPTRAYMSQEETTSSPPTSSHFQGHIQEANINNVGGNYFDNRQITNNHLRPDPARDPGLDVENHRFLDELRKEASLGAVSYAEARADAGRCHPVTRVKVLDDLEAWSVGEGPWGDVKLLVLTGPAGHGKSAIMQTFADRLLEKAEGTDPRPIVATFFFKTTVPEQNQPRSLVTTLAHQIAEHWPSLRHQIIAVLRNNTGIFSISLEHQMKRLLVEPISDSCATAPSSPHLACAVDGLDECNGDEAQARVIRLLHSLSTVPNTRVVISSRPEFPVMAAVAQKMPGVLHVDLNKGDTRDDIYKFVWAQLLEIRDVSRLKIDPLRWPSEEDAWKISDYSSGQFILATTAMRYVGERRHDPRERLKEVLTLCGPGENDLMTRVVVPLKQPLEPLDKLFTGILVNAGRNANPNNPEEEQQKLSSLVWTLMEILGDLPLWLFEEAQGLHEGSIAHELSDLHSLLEVPEDPYRCSGIRPHHKSLLDFLGDPRRSGHFGNVAQVAQERFDQMIKTHLLSLTVNDLKNLVLATPVKPHILHWLHRLCEPKTVIESIDCKLWKALLLSLNAWEMLLLKQWVHVGLSQRLQAWDFRGSETLRMMDEASKRSLHDLLPGLENQGPLDPPPISGTDIELLLATPDGQGDENLECEHAEFIPKQRTIPPFLVAFPSFPWFPAARALAWLWAPSHRLIDDHSRVTQPSDTPNSHPQKPSQIVFVIGSAGSGKRELLEEAYRFLPAGKEDGPPENWMPPVDIRIVPDKDGRSLRSLWTPGHFAVPLSYGSPYYNQDLMGNVVLSPQLPASLFQDCIACWKSKHEKNTYHPQFLLQGLHLLLPEHQVALLDVISSDAGQAGSTGRPPLFITVTSIPTATLTRKLHQFSWPGVYYVNLNGMKADASLLEGALSWQPHHIFASHPPPKTHQMAHILASSPKPARHLKRLIDHLDHDEDGWENRLGPILAAPESEAWRLIEEHFGEIP